MRLDLLEPASAQIIATKDDAGNDREARTIASEITALQGTGSLRLGSQGGLTAARALEILHARQGAATNLILSLSVEAVLHKGLIDEAARAGCIAIELRREGCLREGLASGLAGRPQMLEDLTLGLRRARGLGLATMLDFPLGLAGDDEGVFERGLRFFREAMIAVPRISIAQPPLSDLMTANCLQNGFDWMQNQVLRHREVWRRALWPSGRTREILGAGYAQRRQAPVETRGHYTTTMEMLRRLNRTRRTGARRPLLGLSAATGVNFRPARDWLHIHAATDSTRRTLQVAVEGTLDLRSARKLLDRIGEALKSGVDQVTIDFSGLEWVSSDVMTRFIEENRDRFAAMAGRARLINLGGTVEALRRQLGDAEGVRLLALAIPV
jgi:anti-anti-sigma regulatory factor